MVVIDLVSASKLKTDFKRYERDEIENLSVSEVSEYIESLVAELEKFSNKTITLLPEIKMPMIKNRLINPSSD